jgi:hypothetical protein
MAAKSEVPGVDAPFVVAQNLGEYGAMAGLAAGFESAVNRAALALREPENAAMTALVVIVVGYFLLRRR